jgi:hypothetical protein
MFMNWVILMIRNRFSALRGICPEFEAGSGDFHARTLPDGAFRVKRPACRNAGFDGWLGWKLGVRVHFLSFFPIQTSPILQKPFSRSMIKP